MESPDPRPRDHLAAAGRQHGPRRRLVLVEREIRAVGVVVGHVLAKHSAQVGRAHDNHVVRALSPKAADDPSDGLPAQDIPLTVRAPHHEPRECAMRRFSDTGIPFQDFALRRNRGSRRRPLASQSTWHSTCVSRLKSVLRKAARLRGATVLHRGEEARETNPHHRHPLRRA